MAKTDESTMEEHQAPAVADTSRQQQASQPVQVQVNDEKAIANYANFCRVTGSPEELIVDFGLNPQPVGIPKDPIHVTQRVIMNFYTAKRLLAALQMSVQRHEAVEVGGGQLHHHRLAIKRLRLVLRQHVADDDRAVLNAPFLVVQPEKKARPGFAHQPEQLSIVEVATPVDVAGLNRQLGRKNKRLGQVILDAGHGERLQKIKN